MQDHATCALLLLLGVSACAPAAGRVKADTSNIAPTPSAEPNRPPYSVEALASATGFFEVALSDDGRMLAFVSDKTGERELWVAEVTEQGMRSPVQRTSLREQVSGLAWSPSGDLMFAVDSGGDERPDLWVLPAGGEPERLAVTSVAEGEPEYSPDGKHVAYVADADRPFRFNLHVREMATGKERQLTKEAVNVTMPRWSPDGRMLVATVTPDWQKGELLLVPAGGGAVRRIKPPRADGILWPVGFMPDGRLLSTTVNEGGFEQLCLVRMGDGAVELVGPGDWGVELVEVADDGTVVFVRNVGGESEVVVVPGGVFGAARVVARGGVVRGLSVARGAGSIALLRESAKVPGEVLLQRSREGELRAVVAPESSVVLSDLADAERFVYSSFDGRRIDAWLYVPRVVRLGSPPPAVALVHGGPDGQSRPTFELQAQALAEAGFLVVCVNYRGSSGYGLAFVDLDNKDWGGGDLLDIAAAIDALAREGRIDPARVGIAGGSFGGYMSLRAITAMPERWAAAVDMYGMPDLVEDYELTQDRFGSWYETEMGTPTSHPELFRERSPIHFLDRVRAPLLVLQGENDSNVPKSESDLVVERLRSRGVPVEYVVYANEGHGFTRRENRVDAAKRMAAFFTKHMGDSRKARGPSVAPASVR